MSLSYSSLSDKQRQQAAYLFADELFGTDVEGYLYELNKSGDVIGRTGAMDHGGRSHIRPGIKVTLQEVHVTDEIIQRSRMNMDALAACVAQTIYQHQLEEVHNEI